MLLWLEYTSKLYYSRNYAYPLEKQEYHVYLSFHLSIAKKTSALILSEGK